MWADTDEHLTNEQRERIHYEIFSLISRSIAHTLAAADLIKKADALTATDKISTVADPSCHHIGP
jgi:hypothetical protein